MIIDTDQLRTFLEQQSCEEAERLDTIKDDRSAFAALTRSEQKFAAYFTALTTIEECAAWMEKRGGDESTATP